MTKDWLSLIADLSAGLKDLHSGAPDVMKEFSGLARAASTREALDSKTKELIALAIAVAVRCDPCIAFHAQAAIKRGASRDEVMEAMGMAIYMGAGPSVKYASQAVEAYGQCKGQVAASGTRLHSKRQRYIWTTQQSSTGPSSLRASAAFAWNSRAKKAICKETPLLATLS